MTILLLSTAIAVASAFHATSGRAPVIGARAAVRLFEEKPATDEDVRIIGVTRSREAGMARTGSIVVTDGSGSFYASRTIFTMLNDFGRYKSIVALSDSVVDAKKSLMTRQGRYSGLTDVLAFKEGNDFTDVESWLAISPTEEALPAQIDAAAAAGVSRVFVLLSEAPADAEALEGKLIASGLDYTLMRVGPLVDGGEGGGLKLDAIDMPVCDEVPREDVFRFATEALSMPEASKRAFSLCPSVGLTSTLKQMRLCGYERREEIQLLLSGVVREQDAEVEGTEEEKAEAAELVLRSEAEVAAEREEELKALLSKARQKGIETQQRLEFEAKEKAAKRKEQEKYYQAPKDEGEDGPGDAPVDIPDAPPKPSE